MKNIKELLNIKFLIIVLILKIQVFKFNDKFRFDNE